MLKAKYFLSVFTATTALLISATSTFAHVVVKPDLVGLASTQDFTVGFGVEKDVPTKAVRLVVPEGVESVSPYLKQGWKIEIKKSGEGESAKVTEITWSEGSVPAGLRETFTFRATVPSAEAKLLWKAYQTYQDGTEVAWDQENVSEGHTEDAEKKGPASVTKVVDDLTAKASPVDKFEWVSWSALAISILALFLIVRKTV